MLKIVMIILMSMNLLYKLITNKIRNEYRKRPLPVEVSDIYDSKRYQSFLDYKADQQSFGYKRAVMKLIIDIIVILSPLFSMLQFSNPYITYLVTILVIEIIDEGVGYFFAHYNTFNIEAKYGLNKKTEQEFRKDYGIEFITNTISMSILGIVLILLIQFVGSIINKYQITYMIALGLVVMIGIILFAALLVISLIQLYSLTKQYTITDLEEGELLDEIHKLLTGVKKKIKRIIVYNESKKSVNKNAFVLKLLNYRLIGIADNFLNENAKRELYGVIAHEVGHLKHKKNILNYIKYLFIGIILASLVYLLPHIQEYQYLINGIDQAFGVSENYYVYMLVLSTLLTPIFFLFSIFSNYSTRVEEYEADQNAVKEGYGEDLIGLFKELSKDELIDVNPSPIIEFLEYDHPGMYNRIRGLQGKR